MESFLNLLWVAIALGVFGVWRVYWVRQRGDAIRRPLLEWTAFGCALVLLFFAVSLTDDLHPELVLFDECSTSRRQTSLCACPHHAQHNGNGVGSSGTAILRRPEFFKAPDEGSTFAPLVLSRLILLENDLTSGRAPPVSPL
jgi:hypothetical protein